MAQRRWLGRYSELFDTVEVNSTFYRLASESMVKDWVAQTPESFTFAVKASRYMTHVKRLKGFPYGLDRFHQPLDAMKRAGKLGPILWQLPASFHRNDERLETTLKALPDGRHAFEFRHQSWFCDDVYELLRAHGAALVIADDPERPFQTHERTTDWTFVRLHRGGRGRGGAYSAAEIGTWVRRIAQWRRETEVYAYFNNDSLAKAPKNALQLKQGLGV